MNALEYLSTVPEQLCAWICHVGGDANVLLDARIRVTDTKLEKRAHVGRVFSCSVAGGSANSRGRNTSRDGRESSSMAELVPTFRALGVADEAALSLTAGGVSCGDLASLITEWSLLSTGHRRDGRSPRLWGRPGPIDGSSIGAGRMTGLNGPSVQFTARRLIDAAVKDRKNSCAIPPALQSACHCFLEVKSITRSATGADRDGPMRTVGTVSRRLRIGVRRCEAHQTRCAWQSLRWQICPKGHSGAGTQKVTDVRED